MMGRERQWTGNEGQEVPEFGTTASVQEVVQLLQGYSSGSGLQEQPVSVTRACVCLSQ